MCSSAPRCNYLIAGRHHSGELPSVVPMATCSDWIASSAACDGHRDARSDVVFRLSTNGGRSWSSLSDRVSQALQRRGGVIDQFVQRQLAELLPGASAGRIAASGFPAGWSRRDAGPAREPGSKSRSICDWPVTKLVTFNSARRPRLISTCQIVAPVAALRIDQRPPRFQPKRDRDEGNVGLGIIVDADPINGTDRYAAKRHRCTDRQARRSSPGRPPPRGPMG